MWSFCLQAAPVDGIEPVLDEIGVGTGEWAAAEKSTAGRKRAWVRAFDDVVAMGVDESNFALRVRTPENEYHGCLARRKLGDDGVGEGFPAVAGVALWSSLGDGEGGVQKEYADYDDPKVQSRKCYEVCVKHGKPVIVMEPVKGGNLVNLPESAKAVLDALHGGSAASYAIRFAAGFPGVMMVLSGMSNMEQMRDNLSFMRDFRPLDEREKAAIGRVRAILSGGNLIPCTGCRYCVDGCPKHIAIPELFAAMNDRQMHPDGNADYAAHTAPGRRASDCVKCGKCERACPQHLPIRQLLQRVAREFEQA